MTNKEIESSSAIPEGNETLGTEGEAQGVSGENEFEKMYVLSDNEPVFLHPSHTTEDEKSSADNLNTAEVCRMLEISRRVFYDHDGFGLEGIAIAGGWKAYKVEDVVRVKEQIERQRALHPASIPRSIEVPPDCVDMNTALEMLGIGLTALKRHEYFGMQVLRFSGMKYYFRRDEVMQVKDKQGLIFKEDIADTHMSLRDAMDALGISHTSFHRLGLDFTKVGSRTFYSREDVKRIRRERNAAKKVKEEGKLKSKKIPKRKKPTAQRKRLVTSTENELTESQSRMLRYYLGEIDAL